MGVVVVMVMVVFVRYLRIHFSRLHKHFQVIHPPLSPGRMKRVIHSNRHGQFGAPLSEIFLGQFLVVEAVVRIFRVSVGGVASDHAVHGVGCVLLVGQQLLFLLLVLLIFAVAVNHRGGGGGGRLGVVRQ